MTLAHWLLRTAQAHPDLPAVALGPREARRYGDLARNAAALAGWLRRSGARKVQPVAIISENRVEVLETLFGCWWAGFAVAPIAPDLAPEDLTRALAYAEAETCFVSPKAAGAVMAAAPEAVSHIIEYEGLGYLRALKAEPIDTPLAGSNRDTAWLAFSDLEPGDDPRAAMLSHEALMSLALSLLAEVDPVRPRDAQIHATPWHGPGGFMLLPTLARGGVAVMPETGAFDPAEVYDNAAKWRRASTILSETHLRLLLASGADMDGADFRTVALTGVGASRRLIERGLERFGPRLARIYGQCAFPLGVTRLNCHDVSSRGEAFWEERVASVGRPFLTTEISIRPEDEHRNVEPGEQGWIHVRGQHGMRGYWRDRRSKVSNGAPAWRRTGMRGAVDQHGYLRVHGAPEHMLPGRNGALTAPESLEATLLDRGDAADAGATTRPKFDAFGRPDGEEIVTFVVENTASPPRQPDLIGGAALPIAAQYAVEDLPRSSNGRLRRATLKRWAAERLAEERAVMARSDDNRDGRA
ncbi:MAG: class I adenylate-forming enzyme family protein [Pseudomonadota bacterium]